MYNNLNRIDILSEYFENLNSKIPGTLNKIFQYLDIYKLDYLNKEIFKPIVNESYMIIMKDPNFLNSFPDYNYIILSDRPQFWSNNLLITRKGIFMNVAETQIEYDEFNKKIQNLIYENNFHKPIIICDCNIDISKININNVYYFTILRSNMIREPIKFNKVLIHIEPYVLKYLYNKYFDQRLSKNFEKIIDKELVKGENTFIVINNQNLDTIKLSYL